MNGADLLSAVASRYAAATRYEDQGRVESYSDSRGDVNETYYRTQFERDDFFSFWFETHHPFPPLKHLRTKTIFNWDCSGGETIRIDSNGLSTREQVESIQMGIASFTGVSSCSSSHIPTLLFPGLGMELLTDLQNSQIAGEEEIFGVSCHLVTGTSRKGQRRRLWIGKDDQLIRRIERTFADNRRTLQHCDLPRMNEPKPLQRIVPDQIKISSGTPWESIAGYSRAVKIGNHIWVAGTTSTDPTGVVQYPKDAAGQTRYILHKIELALKKTGATLNDVVRTRLFVTDIARWEAIGRVHGEFFAVIQPATTMVEVANLIDPGLLVEIEVDAYLK